MAEVETDKEAIRRLMLKSDALLSKIQKLERMVDKAIADGCRFRFIKGVTQPKPTPITREWLEEE